MSILFASKRFRLFPFLAESLYGKKSKTIGQDLGHRPINRNHSIFWQCWVRDQHELAEFSQTAELLARAKSMQASGSTPIIIDGGTNIGLATR
jgi:hypothetical protein